MLTSLHVRDLVVVREIEVDFSSGLTVLSGETGAGKSILIEALSLALGERADSKLVRSGAERAVVTASFVLDADSGVHQFLDQHDLDQGDECLLRRVVGRDGRSRAWCNGSPVNLAMLRTLAAMLVDIHAQHANLRLLERDQQRQLLDGYGDLHKTTRAVVSAWQQWKTTRDAIDALARDGADQARIALLRYQVEELDAAKLDATELASLEAEFKQAANSGSSLEALAQVRAALTDEQAGALSSANNAQHALRELSRLMADTGNLNESIDQAVNALNEALSEIDRLESTLDSDPRRVAALDARLSELHGLARKHQIELEGLGEFSERLHEELAALEQRLGSGEALHAALAEHLALYRKAATRLTRARNKAAREMNDDITARMQDLGLPHARFDVHFEPTADGDPAPHGDDRIEFHVSTNPEQAPDRVARVASGGELSRIGLAIQAATARHTGVPVVIYDEVDSGIGGTTATIVGRNLRQIAGFAQVICITHSPQVASAGDHHLEVSKQIVAGQAETVIKALDQAGREAEIARMLGAATATRSSIRHARDLIQSAAE